MVSWKGFKSHFFLLTYALQAHSDLFTEPLQKQFNSSSKALNSVALAESYIKKGNRQDLQKAIVILEKAIADFSFKRLDYATQIPIFMTLANAYQMNGQHKQEDDLLLSLINNPNLESFSIRLQARLISSYIIQARLETAESHLKKLTKIDAKTLPQEERAEIASLIDRLEYQYELLLQEAEKSFLRGNYKEAISYYKTVLHACQKRSFPKSYSRKQRNELIAKTQYRLGIANFLTKNFSDAALVLIGRDIAFQENSKALAAIFQNGTYCLAVSQKKLKCYKEALTAFEMYLTKANPLNAPYYYEAHLNAAICAFHTASYPQALEHLKTVASGNKKISLQGQILQAKVESALKRDDEAIKILDNLVKHTSKSDKSHYEALYEKGAIYLKLGKKEEGILLIEESIPDGQQISSLNWEVDALNLLGKAYLDLAATVPPDEQKAYLERSSACLLKSIAQSQNPQAYLLLAQNYFLRITQFQEKSKIAELEALAKEKIPQEIRLEIEILLAQTENHKNRFEHLLGAKFQNLASYYKVLYLKALDAAQAGNFKEALESLQKALDTADKKLQLEIAKALIAIAPDKAILLLDKLRSDNQEDVDFLLIKATTQKTSEDKALRFLKLYPKSSHIPETLHHLGCLKLENRQFKEAIFCFTKVLQEHPSYSAKDHVLYSAAMSYDQLPKEGEAARLLRKELATTFPQSPYAADAAFRLFPEKEYLLGTPHAISHLKTFVQSFPNSPYAISAHFYIGAYLKQESTKLQYQEQKEAQEIKTAQLKQVLTECCQADTLFKELTLPKSLQLYLTEIEVKNLLLEGYTLLELATSGSNKVQFLDDSENCLESLIQLTKTFLNKTTQTEDPKLFSKMFQSYQEGTYLLAVVYEKENRERDARKQLESLIQCTESYGLKGEFFTKAYLKLAITEQKIELFTQAEKSVPHPKSELLLDISIGKSYFYVKQGELDRAMTLLSHVINADSASQLRIKAMLLRAEIYELQHRRDLAIKQLEAAGKKGGEWGQEAKRKLKEMYGY
jgi:tetratricopeptide (TPR) repeat protein